MISLNNVHKLFAGRTVLDDVSAVFEQGLVNLVIGQSGSGKTVLLKSIVGLLEIDSGHILYDGRDFVGMNSNDQKKIRQEIGMVFQGGALFDFMTVEENVMFPLDMFTMMTYRERRKRARFCLDRVNLKGAEKRFPSEISGGMQKRVAIARAIALNPKYLFCDEPNSGLDPKTSILIDQLILEITHEFNITTVINTHDMNSVLEIGERINFIHQGKKWWEGTKETVLDSANVELQNFVFATEVMRRVQRSLKD